MSNRPEQRQRIVEPALWVFGVGLLVFVSRGRLVWASGTHSWLWPFVLWGALIALGAVVNRRSD
jgi:hypothetical protein